MKKGTIKLDQDVIDIISKALVYGLPAIDACKLSGISHETYYRYINDAKKILDNPNNDEIKHYTIEQQNLLCDLYDKIQCAPAKHKLRNLKKIQKAGAKDWRASAWLVEKADPKNFGKTTMVVGDKDNPIRVESESFEKAVNKIVEMLDSEDE